MKNLSKFSLSIITLMTISSFSFAQNNVNNNFETSANITSFCQIQSNDINFGVVSLPLTAQSANAQMNVLCSNSTAYKVDLSYGGNYVGDNIPGSSGVSGISTSIAYKTKDSFEASSGNKASGYRLYKNGQPISNGYKQPVDDRHDQNLNGDNNYGDFSCNSSNLGQIYFRTLEASTLVQNTSVISKYVVDIHGLCGNGRINQNNFTKLFGGTAIADKGIMTGTFKGDKLAYQVTLPGDSSKPWIVGVNSYESIGIGSHQTIEMNAKLVPASSSSSYIAADTYLDTIIATISY